jgi:hypothetical protein
MLTPLVAAVKPNLLLAVPVVAPVKPNLLLVAAVKPRSALLVVTTHRGRVPLLLW